MELVKFGSTSEKSFSIADTSKLFVKKSRLALLGFLRVWTFWMYLFLLCKVSRPVTKPFGLVFGMRQFCARILPQMLEVSGVPYCRTLFGPWFWG